MGRLRNVLLGRESTDPFLEDDTNSSILPSISDFWSETFGNISSFMSPHTAERVWAANRCIQLNAQQIASMPLRFGSNAPAGGFEPAWVANPDPVWYPNGISDALFSAVKSIYGWGYALIQVTSRYASGTPSGWTVLDPDPVSIEMRGGRRVYKLGGRELDPLDIVQIDRNPGHHLHGTSALRSYAVQAWGLLGASDLARSVMQGGIPKAVLKSKRKLTSDQAKKLQAQWVTRTQDRGGAPPVLPPDLDFETLSFSPSDLMLLDGLNFTARVIASAYGVPPFLLNLPLEGGLTYQNPAMLGEMWWRFELRPTAKRVADAMTAQMLPRGNWVWFDAADTFLPLDQMSDENDQQLSQVADASPSQQTPAVVTPIRSLGGAG